MWRKAIAFFLALIMCASVVPTNAFAYTRKEHDEMLKEVLFGKGGFDDSGDKSDKRNDKLKSINCAAYLCIDQSGKSGDKDLEFLESQHIPDLPSSIEDISVPGGKFHRRYSHLGWDHNYRSISHWDDRSSILVNTVDEVFFKDLRPLITLPFDEGAENLNSVHTKQCESFCKLVYYTHLLLDHHESAKKKSVYSDTNKPANLLPLSCSHDKKEPGIIPDLLETFETLFESQKRSGDYKKLKRSLKRIKKKVEEVWYSDGGLNTEEKRNQYGEYVIELYNTLVERVPKLLEEEEFFSRVFYE